MVAISRIRSFMLILVRLYSTVTASSPAQNTMTQTTISRASIIPFTISARSSLTATFMTKLRSLISALRA